MLKKDYKVLVIDDEEAICNVLKVGLELYGFIVRGETRSTNAIQACLEFHPDIVLLDVAMPDKDGGQVASELKSHPVLGRTPLIFLTSLVSKGAAAKLNVPNTLILSKPILIAQLAVKIRVVLLKNWTCKYP